MFRLLRRKRVPWVVLENVPFMLQLSQGRAMAVIVAAVEDLGYRWAYRVVNSRAFGVPQRRERVVFVATTEGDPRRVLFADVADEPTPIDDAVDKVACGFYWTEGIRGLGWAADAVPTLKGGSTIGIASPPAILMPDGVVVTPDIRDAERLQGFAPDWTVPANNVTRATHRWKLVGNAVTVDMAEWLGARLRAPSEVECEVACSPMQRRASWPRAAFNVGSGIRAVDISAFPCVEPHQPLHRWLKYPGRPLSLKATRGFLQRTEVSSLNFPSMFLKRLRGHLRAMERATNLERVSVA